LGSYLLNWAGPGHEVARGSGDANMVLLEPRVSKTRGKKRARDLLNRDGSPVGPDF